jgi:outer membrane lipoprotein-sorting protein
MLSFMKDLEQIHRQRQRMLVAVALIGLGLLFVTMLTAGSRSAGAEALEIIPAVEDEEAIAQASAYLASLENMQGDFLQVGPDGSVTEGKFYLRRPGRMRFEYNAPENLLVVADGTWVAVKDSAAPAQRYPIASTPLSLFLARDINLSENARVLGVANQPGALLVTIAAPHAASPMGCHGCARAPDDCCTAQCRNRHSRRQLAFRAAGQPAPGNRRPAISRLPAPLA